MLDDLASRGLDACEAWRVYAGPYAPVAWNGRAFGVARRWRVDLEGLPLTLGVVTFTQALDECARLLTAGAVSPWWFTVERVERRLTEEVHQGRAGGVMPQGTYDGGPWRPSPCEDPRGVAMAYAAAHAREFCRSYEHCATLVPRALAGLWVPSNVARVVRAYALATADYDPSAPTLRSVKTCDLLRQRARAACWECDGYGQTLTAGACGACGGGGVER